MPEGVRGDAHKPRRAAGLVKCFAERAVLEDQLPRPGQPVQRRAHDGIHPHCPGAEQGMWSPISSTLIYGKRDAVLVDAFITIEQSGEESNRLANETKRIRYQA
jgi:hypothetical protein